MRARIRQLNRPLRRMAVARAAAGALLTVAALSTAQAEEQRDDPTPTPPPDVAAPEAVAPKVEPLEPIAPTDAERIYLDAAGFRALFEGKTVHLSSEGRHYGSEYYKSGDRSVWVATDQPCRPGVWYYETPNICFQYDDDGPHCWRVFQRGEGLFAESTDGFVLDIYAVDEKPISCAPELLS
ncbi:MAG: hypothetical protein AAF909_06530 [Pseudomonadota bacterium]